MTKNDDKITSLNVLNKLRNLLTDNESNKAIDILVNKLSQTKKESYIPKGLNGDLILYTDGACRGNPGPGAYAFLIEDQNKNKISEGSAVETMTTNNKMELLGVINALQEIEAQVKPKKEILVVTDSKYVIDGITKWVPGWKRRGWKKADNKTPENLDLWQALDDLYQKLNPQFEWVKGHSGHEQNDYVDKMANKALDEAGF